MNNTDSILTSIKKLLGIDESYDHFDADLIIYINSVFLTLTQIGVGPEEGFSISDDQDVWTDFLEEGPLLNSIKPYVHMKVRLLFDPPNASSAIESMNRIIAEFEWRIMAAVDHGAEEEEIQNG